MKVADDDGREVQEEGRRGKRMLIEVTPKQSYRVMVVWESVERHGRVAGSYVCFGGLQDLN